MNQGTIFLGGGGDTIASFAFDQYFFSLLPLQARILYIPVALRRGMRGYESCFDWFSHLIGEHSQLKNIDFEMMLEDVQIPALDTYDAVYIGGGNTYHLLRYLEASGLRQRLITYVYSGGIVYGGSAGAIVLGKDIRTAEEENDRGSARNEGLNLLGEKSIYCHYTHSVDSNISRIVEKISSSVFALPEDSGIVWKNERIEKVFGEVFLFDSQGKLRIDNYEK